MSRRNSNPPVPPGGNDDHLTPHTIPAPMSSSASTLSVRSGDLQEDYTKFAIPTPRYEDDSAKSSKDSLPQDLPIQPTAHPTGDNQLGITWTNLTVKGIMPGATINENVFSQFNSYQKFKESRGPKPLKTIIDDSHGCVKPGEMLLVVGRPGAGCTTLLNMLANRRSGYAEVEGDVYYGSMHHKEAKQYPGQIVMNTEEEVFFPTLTVQQTMDFATTMKMPFQSTEEQRVHERDEILDALNISHTKSTKVGNEFVRGVSGGERKRVSIAEILATRASVYCWDNPTRGLDASTALEFTRHLRHLTDTMGLTNIVTLYQPGNGIYNEFDKVLVLDQGKQIYYGPRAEALPFMQKLGFFCDPSANVADFLSGLTVPTERQILPGFEDRFPRTADEILAAYLASPIKAEMEKEYSYPTSEDARSKTKRFQEHVRAEKHKSLPDSSTLTSSPVTQIMGTVRRQVQILWGDKPTFMIKNISTIIQALINGSVFYNAADDSTGLFLKGGALFLSLLYPSLLAMSETTDSFVARPVLAKHRMMAYHDPAAFCLAQILIDIPVSLLIVTPFSVIIYFMVGLRTEADAFFTYWFMLFSATMTMTVFFRFCGAAFSDFQSASKISGFAVSAIATYVGYMIPKPDMHPWFVWIYWINPLAYGFESLLSNEFHGRTIQCAGNNLIPLGPSYRDNEFQACSGVRGVTPGASSFTGDQYLQSLAYSHSHMWRNFGIMWAWWALFAFLTIYFTRGWKQTADGSRSLLLPRENVKKVQAQKIADEENAAAGVTGHANAGSGPNADSEKGLIRNTSVFTWKNLSYTVPTPEGERTLLHNVNGWVKPGQLGALMGSSGAGKTTLMDVLAQRKTSGTIHGSIQVDGRPLPVSFQRSAGYCEQLDVHERMATVREALEFAALLRQSRDTPKEEKIKYVDTIVDLLELQDIENTLIGSPGNGLSIEQRKRVTIAVELVSKPDILIFLDEPTSGLDGQAAFSTVRFLRKLADVGQAVLVTIHQPSASLFAQFDTLLLLQKGGKTAYFGEIGEKAATLKEYFGRYGAPCPPEANPAEHMIDVVSGRLSGGQDWHEVWLSSPECEKSLQELDRIIADAAAKPPGSKDDGHEFAAPIGEQIRILSRRMNIALFRDIEYVNNRVALHIGSALFNGFTFWMVKDHVADLQLRLFAVFNFIFVAPGVFAQLQPLFLERRDIYETREKKSKTYHWSAFVTALIISEIPYLLFCGLLYWACFYYTVGFPTDSNKAGATLFVMLVYELLYTGMGQFIAAYAPNAVFASLVNPVVVGVLVTFCGVLVPYQALTAFWRYWLYYLDPLTYIMSAMLVFTTYDAKVVCSPSEMAIFNTPGNVTCGEYLADYRSGIGAATMLMNPDATSGCQVCQYRRGSDYLYTLNIKEYLYGWRDSAIGCLFVLSSYGLVYLLMKLRTKATKKAED